VFYIFYSQAIDSAFFFCLFMDSVQRVVQKKVRKNGRKENTMRRVHFIHQPRWTFIDYLRGTRALLVSHVFGRTEII